MSNSILATKLYIPPPRPQVVLRTRLIEQLNKGLYHKLTVLSAPAGFGKTTLVSEWVACCGRPTAWFSLDNEDNDVVRFMNYLIAALQTIIPGIGSGVSDLLQTQQIPPIEHILTSLINEIAAVKNHFTLVLDDYHELDSNTIDQAISYLLDHLPVQMHLVITTREDPNLPLTRLRARDQLTEIRAAELRVTFSEASEFLNKTMGLDLSEENISVLETRTEGWIAGLQLAALSMQKDKDVSEFIRTFGGDHRYIVDYLVEEVLQHLPATVRNFLLQTSILDQLNGSLCDAVTGQKNSQAQLEALQNRNFFLIPLDEKRYWYRYHHLFADVLRMSLMTEQPEIVSDLHRRASEWYERNGSAADSIHHALAGSDFERVAELAETTWQDMYESFQAPVWLGWVKQLPEEVTLSRPILCTQIALGLMNVQDVDGSESRLQDAERCLKELPVGNVNINKTQFRSLQARIAFARAYNAQTRRDFPSAIKYAKLVFDLISDEDQFLRAQTSAILGVHYLINGDLDAACQSMDNWIDNSIKTGNYFSAFAYAMVEKADILTSKGHLQEALRTYQQALQLASKHDSRVLRVMAHPHLGMAILYHEMGDDKAADQHFKKSLELASLHKSIDWSYRRCVAQSRLKESLGELDTALELLEESKLFYIKTLMPLTRPVDAIKARIYLKQGRLFKAEEWVNKQGFSLDDELTYLREYEHIVLSRVLLAEYQINHDEHVILKVLSFLKRLLKAAEDRKRLGSIIQILLTQALSYHVKGDTPNAHASLERALVLAQPEGYFRIFVDEGDNLHSLLFEFRKAFVKQSRVNNQELLMYVDKLLSAFSQPRHIQKSKQIEPLSQRELDILRLLKTELSGPEIAQEYVIALSTVRTHTKSIYSKLNVNSRRGAVKRAIELGLL